MKDRRRSKKFVERRKSIDVEPIPPLPFKQRHARILMTVALLVSDLSSLFLASILAIWLRTKLMGDFDVLIFQQIFPILFFFILIFALYGLYPGVGLSPVQEIKQLFNATGLVFLLLIAITFWQTTFTNYSRFIITITWLLAMVLVQVSRWLTRIVGRWLGFWGEPVAVVGNGPEAQQIIKFLKDSNRLGMKPVLNVDGHVPYKESALITINRSRISTVILVTSEMSPELQTSFINDQRYGYHRRRGEKSISNLILITSLGWVGSLGVTPIDLDGMLGLGVRQNLLNKWPNLVKRSIDLILTIIVILVSLPFLLLIALLIVLESPGNILYKQERVGRNGNLFQMYKFRTMKMNAEQILEELLDSDPKIKSEWDSNHKLKKDPRITKVGEILRKYSLDEIPQLINVIKGEMSIVGPRPIFENQQKIFGEDFRLYYRVRPGMTGMWQTRGRSDISFISKERQKLDEYYIRNWSVWLDVYLLLRTILVVCSRKGAY